MTSEFLISVLPTKRSELRARRESFDLKVFIESVAMAPQFLSNASKFAVTVRLTDADASAVRARVAGWCRVGPRGWMETLDEDVAKTG